MFVYISVICLLGFLAAVGCKGSDWPHPMSIVAVGLLASGASLFGVAAAALGRWGRRCALLALGAMLFGAQFLVYMLRDPASRLAYVDWWDTGPDLLYRGSFTMLLVFVAIVFRKRRESRGLDRRIDFFFVSIARLQFGLGHLLLMTFFAAVILTLSRVKTPYLDSHFPWLVNLNDYLIGAACETAVALGVLWIGRDLPKVYARLGAATLFAVGVSLIEPYHYKLNWQESLAWIAQGTLQAWVIFLGVVFFGKRQRRAFSSLALDA
jgi:hypothetical protein